MHPCRVLDVAFHVYDFVCLLSCVLRVKKFHGLPTGSSGGSHSGKVPVADKLSKGLRHFSWRVCEKVQQKKVTTYNEVCSCMLADIFDRKQ